MDELRREWLQHPYTKELIKEIREIEELVKEEWSTGRYTGPTAEATAQLNAERIGQIGALRAILEFLEEKE